MQVSYFETGRYYAPSNLPRQWSMPAGAYDREAGSRAFRGMVERSRYAEELGFDWVSVSEHHYSPHILTPSLPIAAAYIASHVHDIKIALLARSCRRATRYCSPRKWRCSTRNSTALRKQMGREASPSAAVLDS